MMQNREGLPPSLTEQRRFFEMTGPGKEDTPKGWNDPETWMELDDIPEDKPFGFVAGTESSYLFIDFDHVIDAGNHWVNDDVKAAYQRIRKAGKTYQEGSISGHGIHMICDLGDYAESFDPVNNTADEIIVWMDPDEYRKLPKEERDKVPKIELFYKQNGRYILLTGKNKKVDEVARDEEAAAIFRECLAIRSELHAKYSTKREATTDFRSVATAAKRQEVEEVLSYVSAADRETWVHVGIALYNAGFDFDLWDEWSQWTDKRAGIRYPDYSQEGNNGTVRQWKSFAGSKSRWNLGTVYRLAKEGGWNGSDQEDPETLQSLEPSDYTDVGQSKIFVQEYGDRVRYSLATKYLVYTGRKWEENELKAQQLSQALTERQLGEARTRLSEARAVLDAAVESGDEDAAKAAKPGVKKAEKFRNYVLTRRSTNKIKATLTEAAPSVQIEVDQLDADGYLLNTPAGTVDLRSGRIQSHRSEDHCTKITALAPSREGEEIWTEFLRQITCEDADLQRYLQDIAGICTIGHVKREELIIATGSGGNGKSTFFNLLFRILGDYAGMLSAETLTTGSRNNKSPEYAELRGKRMIIAAELEEGTRLDTSTVKKLCSTDTIIAEKKYRDPFHFVPSHHVILYTNHLPKVGTNDAGTWARLVVVPFNATFRGQADEVKDYAGYLYEHCGGAALSWMIEGARRVISQEFKITLPAAVTEAVEVYRSDNDWLAEFILERCVTGRGYSAAAPLYEEYEDFCESYGEYKRSSREFFHSLEAAGYKKQPTTNGKIYHGIRVKTYPERMEEQALAAKYDGK